MIFILKLNEKCSWEIYLEMGIYPLTAQNKFWQLKDNA